jgi:hypothetical protein
MTTTLIVAGSLFTGIVVGSVGTVFWIVFWFHFPQPWSYPSEHCIHGIPVEKRVCCACGEAFQSKEGWDAQQLGTEDAETSTTHMLDQCKTYRWDDTDECGSFLPGKTYIKTVIKVM